MPEKCLNESLRSHYSKSNNINMKLNNYQAIFTKYLQSSRFQVPNMC